MQPLPVCYLYDRTWCILHAPCRCQCLYESAESGCHLCVFVWDAFRPSKRFSEFIPASTIPENNLEFPFIRFVLRHDTDLHLMMYHFDLAFEKSSDDLNTLGEERNLPGANIIIVPFSNDSGIIKLFSKSS